MTKYGLPKKNYEHLNNKSGEDKKVNKKNEAQSNEIAEHLQSTNEDISAMLSPKMTVEEIIEKVNQPGVPAYGLRLPTIEMPVNGPVCSKEDLFMLMKAGKRSIVQKRLLYFGPLDSEVAEALIEDRQGFDVLFYYRYFTGLDYGTTLKRIIEVGDGKVIIDLGAFPSNSELCMRTLYELMKNGCGKYLYESIEYLNNRQIEYPIMLTILLKARSNYVSKHKRAFKHINPERIMQSMLSERPYTLEEYLAFTLDNKTAQALIDMGEVWFVAAYLEHFRDLDVSIAQKVIEFVLASCRLSDATVVAKNLAIFVDGSQSQIALEYMKVGEEGVLHVFKEKFTDLNREAVLGLLECEGSTGYGFAYNYMQQLKGEDYKAVLMKFIEKERFNVLVENITDIDEQYHEMIAIAMIEHGCGWWVIDFWKGFKGLDAMNIIWHLIQHKKYVWQVIRDLKNFEGIDRNAVKQMLIENGYEDEVEKNLKNF